MAPGSPIHCDQAVHAGVDGFLGPLPLRDVVVDDATRRGDTIHYPAWFAQRCDEEADPFFERDLNPRSMRFR